MRTPTAARPMPEATEHDIEVIVLCDEGCASSPAADSLRHLGPHRTTDVGGHQAWAAAGLPTTRDSAP